MTPLYPVEVLMTLFNDVALSRTPLRVLLVVLLLFPVSLLAQPTISTYNPLRNTTATALSSNIVLTWSEAMSTATLTSGTVRVYGSQRGLYSTSATFSYSGGNTIVTIDPVQSFRPGELISVSVTNAQNSSTTPMTRATVWSFMAAVQGGFGVFENTWEQSSGATNTWSVALGDFDGDGDLDVFEGNRSSQNNKVWRNDGSGNFSNTWEQSSGATTTYSVALGDVDGDGDLDVFEGNFGANNKVWSNDGAGNFTNTWTQSSGTTNTTSVALGDVDGDGDLDVFEGSGVGNNMVWSNDGAGNFTNTWTQGSGATETTSVALGDLDGDGDLDVFEGNSNNQNNKVWSNDGAGNFTNTWTQSSGATSTWSVALGDVDGDGDLDVFEGNYGANNKVWSNNGAGNFSNTWTQSSGTTSTTSVALGDVDGDGDLDVFEGNDGANNKVWFNNAVPVVTAFSPSTNALHVVSTASVSLAFNTSMNVSSLTSANIRITGSQTGLYSTSAIVYSSTTNSVSLTPSAGFKPGELITVGVTTGVQSADGLSITRATVWSFMAAVQGGSGMFGNTWTQSSGATNTNSVALGDVDGDGDLDVFEGNYSSQNNRVWSNDGAGNFSNTWTQSSGATNTRSVALGDVDGDGDLDVFEGNESANNKVWSNDGSGNFTNTWTQSSGSTATYSVALGDVDGDGDLDVFEGNFAANNKVWSNDGSGNFTNTWTQSSGSTATFSVALVDVDGDGDLDVFEGNFSNQNNKVWSNDGAGNFSNTWTQSSGATNTFSVALGDMDGDGDLDVFEGNYGSQNNKVWSNNGAGNFSNTWTQSSGATNTYSVALGDVDGDGDLDVFEGNYGANNKVWSNNGAGNFSNTWTQSSGATNTFSVALGDVDGDGDVDVFEGNTGANNKVWFNAPAPVVTAFSPSTNALHVVSTTSVSLTFSTSMNVSSLTSASIRITGSQTGLYSTSAITYSGTTNSVSLTPSAGFKPGELITVGVTTGVQSAAGTAITRATVWSFMAAVQGGSGAFENTWTQSSGSTATYSVALGDVDGDGDLDVFEGNDGANNKVWSNDGSGNFTNTWTQSGGATYTTSVALGDVDGDGDLDVFEGNASDNNKAWSNDGAGNFTNTWTQSSGSTDTYSVALGDLDGDGDLDVFEGNYNQNNKVWSNDGVGNFTNTWTQSSGTTNTYSVALGDVDGDGDLDVFEGNYSNQNNKVWSNDGAGSFTNTWTQSSGATNTQSVAMGDVDGDGDLDMFEGNAGENNKVWSNNGSGNFTNTWTQSSGATNTLSVALGDVDGDGDLDVFEGNYDQNNKVWSNNGTGNFTNTWTQSSGATNTFSVALGDVDGDGDLDVFEGNYDQNNKVWFNAAVPVVTAFSPSTNALHVVSAASVSLAFSTSMNVSSLTSASIRISGSQTGLYSTSAITYSSTTNSVSLTPSAGFKPGELITVGVTTGVQSAAGLSITRATVWSFMAAVQGGSGVFENTWTQSSGATDTRSVALGDVDGDGDLDVFEGNWNENNKVWSNDGAGNFTNTWTQSSGSTFTLSVALGDVDGDGDLDVFEGNYGENNKVWRNDGAGNFTNTWTQSSGSTDTRSVVLGDVDGDGDLDVFEGNYNQNNKVWSNDGSGNFSNTWTQSSGATNTFSVALGDVDGDGDLDVFEGNYSNQNNKVWSNDGSGNFSNTWTQSSGATNTSSVALGDLDGDGDLDVFEGNDGANNTVWSNNGAGNFTNTWTQSSGTTNTYSVALGDVDGDGDLDVFEGNSGSGGTNNKVWANNGVGSFSNTWTQSSGATETNSVALGDVDGDGDVDVFEGNYNANNKVWFNAAVPVVTAFSPSTNALHVVSTASVSLTFSTSINVSSLTSTSIRISGSQTGLYSTSAIAYSSTTNSVSLTPSAGFKPGELITVGVTTGVQSAAGVHTTRATVWSFIAAVQGGPGVFENTWTQSSGANRTASVALGDVDGDGDLDVFEGNLNSNNNTVWRNDGAGNFNNTWTQSSGATFTASVAFGDVDGDGDLDVFEGNSAGGGAPIGDNNKVWSNDGAGNFTNTWTQSSGATQTQSVALGDVDGDGDLDVFEGNYSNQNNKVWSNDGSGNFSNTWTQSSGATFTLSVALGDVDGDGDLDVFEGNISDNKVWSNDGAGNFSNTWTQSTGATWTASVAFGDVDGDGDLDVFEGNDGENKVRSNNGAGNFSNTWTQSSGATFTASVALGDVDGDGDLDVFEGNDGPGGANNKVWFNTTVPVVTAFSPSTNALHVVSTASVSLAFNTSMNVSSLTSANIRITGSQTGLYSTSAIVYSSTTNSVSLTPSADFKSGELITVGVTTGVQSADGLSITRATVWSFMAAVQGGPGVFTNTWTQSGGATTTWSVALGDVDDDGDLDMVEGNFDKSNKVWTNDGNGNLSNTWTQSSGTTGTWSIALGDLDGDGDLDMVEGNLGQNNKVWLNDGNGNFTNTWTQSSGATNTQSIALGDIDGDGDLDMIEGNSNENNKVWTNDGNGNFANTWTQSSGATFTESIALGDLDGDGDLDVFEGSSFQGNKVWLNDGSGNLSNTWEQSSGATNTQSIALGDLDGDGDLDVFEGNSGANNKVWTNDGSGNFTNTWTQSSGATSTQSIAMGDVDGDGDLDVVEGNSSQNNRVWTNDGAGNFTNTWTQSSGATNTQSIALGDLDGDGDMDMAEGNENQSGKVWLNAFPTPILTAISPSTNALAVVSTASVSVTFSTSMNVSTLTSANIRITGNQTGVYSTSAIAYNSTTNTVLLQPSAFKPGELITVDVTTAVQSAVGVNTTRATIWSFTAAVQGGAGEFHNFWAQGSGATNTRSIALGDLDGDGDLDMVEGNLMSGGYNKVWSNDGSGNFTNTWTQSSGETSTLSITLGDVDGDGDLDVFEGNSGNNKVWSNDGSGNFTNTWTQSSGATSTQSIALGDLDGDGDLDVFEGNTGDPNKVWLNDGSGNFTNTWTQSSGATNTESIALGDVDGDGDVDVFEGNGGSANKAWLNDGNGNFANTWTQSSGTTSTYSIALGDVDGDGDLDVFEGNRYSESNKAWLNDGNGNFANTWTQSSGTTSTYSIALGDVDGDGDLDVFEGNHYSDPNKVWLNDGSGNFTNTWTQQSMSTTNTLSIAIGDLDGDGDLDVFEGNYGENNKVWLNAPIPVVIAHTPSTNALHVVSTANVSVSFNTSMNVNTLTSANIRITGSQTGVYSTNAIAYNGTTNTVLLQPSAFKPGELITVDVTTGVQSAVGVHTTRATIWSFVTAVQGGTGTFENSWTQSSGTTGTSSIALGDLDGDGDLDVFEGNSGWSNRNNKVWLNDGAGNFTNTWTQSSDATQTQSIALGDLDGDGDLDVFEGHDYNQNNKVWLNDGSGNFTSAWEQSSGATRTRSIALGDLDGDGDLDMFEGNYNQNNKVWLNDGVGNFTNTWTQSGGATQTYSIALGDLDGDGDLDVFEGNAYSELNKVWSNDGSGNFTNTWEQGSGATNTYSIALGDLDGDGDLDMFEGNLGDNNKVWTNDGSGNFTNSWTQSSGATQTWSIALGDLDGDGDLDMFEGNYYGENNKVWQNDGSGSFSNTWTQGSDATSPLSIALGDLDGDGDLDMFEGNFTESNKVWLNARLHVVVQSQSTTATNSGGDVTLTLQLQTEKGIPFTVPQGSKVVGLISNHPSLQIVGTTQATVIAEQNSTTLTIHVQNTTLSPVTTSLTIRLEEEPFTVTLATLTVGANNAPTIGTSVTTIMLLEDSVTRLTVSVSDVETATTALVITATSSNVALLPNSAIVQVGATGATTLLDIQPVTNGNGVVEVYVSVSDGLSVATTRFSVTVVAVNDAPSFSTTVNIAVLDEDGALTYANHLTSISPGPVDEAGQAVQFFTSNNNNALFAVQPSISSTGTLSFTPAQWTQGVAVVSVYAQDGGGTTNGGINTSATLNFPITVGLSPVTHLRMVGVSPSPAQSGETIQLTMASYTAAGTQRATTANTTVGLLWDATYLPVLLGSTQAVLSAGSSEATISVAMFSSSTANITLPATVEAVGGVLIGTTTSFAVQHAVPSVPSATTNNQQASLNWTAPVAQGVTGYAVFRGTASGNLVEIGTSATTSYMDNTAANGTTYYYAVQSVAGVLRSGLSGETSVTIPRLTVLTPNGGEQWRIGVMRTVSWQTITTVATVSVEYSLNNGSSWLLIASSTNNTGSVLWHIVTTATSTTALVRVYDVSRPSVQDRSDVVFSILEPIAPATSLSASALDEAVQLSWSASTTPDVTGYAIYHGLTSGSLSLLATVGTSATTYTHTGLSDGLRHYYALGTLIGGDESLVSAEASVIPNTMRVLYANGGEVLQVGTQQNLQWQYSGDISSMQIEYSTDNGSSWTSISQIVSITGNKSLTVFNQNWTVPNTPTTTALIRVQSISPTTLSDQSDAVFAIQAIAPPINLMATAGSTTISLSWTASTSANVGGYRVLRGTTTSSLSEIASVGITNSYTDASANVCTQYYYAVQTRVGGYASANSNIANARIVLPESVTVVSPNGGESWQAGVTRWITWTSTACTVPSSVILEYSTNNGGSWSTIATVTNTGSYAWSIPNTPSVQALVRISGDALSDQSDGVFTIAPIPAPSALAASAGNTTVQLNWTGISAEGVSGYAVWRGTTSGSLSLLTTVSSSATTYTDNSVTNCTLSVYGVTAMVSGLHSASSNQAQAVPLIPPALSLVSPNGGESWQVGTTPTLTWTSTGCSVPSTVTLQYSTNNGGSWSTIATVGNTGSYAWLVPNTPSVQALVSVSGGALTDQSDAVFVITAIPAPTGLTASAGNATVQLNWTASGAESLSGYGIWRGTTTGSLSLQTTVSSSATMYTDNSVTNCTLYVYAVSSEVGAFRSVLSAEAQAVPQIPASLTVLTPNGGEQWRMYLPHVITWTSTGCSVPATVSIELSLNNGGSWTSVTTATANTGSYTWTPVGLTPSAQALVRVSGGVLSDVSNAVFELQPRPYPSATATPVATSASYCSGSSIPTLGTSLALADDYYSATTLVVSVATSNPALLPTSGIVQTSATGATTTFAFAPVAGVAGTANVTFTVRNAVESTVTTTVSVSVVVYALPSAVITGSTSVCAGSAGHTYSVPTSTGGTYTWTVVGGSVTSGAGSREITLQWENVGIGSVGVVVTTVNDCWASNNMVTVIRANPVPSITVGGATTVCSGSSVALTAQPSGMGYVWSNGATTQSISATQSGNYSVVVTNQYGCSTPSTSVSVTVHPAVTASATANGSTTLCSGSSVQLVGDAASSVGGVSFAWSPQVGLSNANIAQPIATPSATTTYTLLVSDGNGCSSTASVTITVLPAPATTISSNATICVGGSTQLVATGGTSYSWTPATGLSNAGVANPVATPSTTTTYTVTINTGGSCPVQRSVTVTVVAPIVAGVSGDVDVCIGNSTQLVATGGTSYSWVPATGLSNAGIANPIASPSATTTYTVTVSNAGGCSSTANVTVAVHPVVLSATVLLEGAYAGGSLQTGLQQQGLIPTNQPYNVAPFNYTGTETLGVTSGTAIVDWVLVDLRSGTGAGSLVERRAALLRSDGTIVGSDGTELVYPGIPANSYYLVVWHRNHLGVMSARPANVIGNCSLVYNFTVSPGSAYSQFGSAQKQVGVGVYGMVAGDANGDGIINAIDRVFVRNDSGTLGYELADVSLDGVIDAVDRVLVRNNAFLVTQVP